MSHCIVVIVEQWWHSKIKSWLSIIFASYTTDWCSCIWTMNTHDSMLLKYSTTSLVHLGLTGNLKWERQWNIGSWQHLNVGLSVSECRPMYLDCILKAILFFVVFYSLSKMYATLRTLLIFTSTGFWFDLLGSRDKGHTELYFDSLNA